MVHLRKVSGKCKYLDLSRDMTKPTKWVCALAKTQISLGIRPVWSVFAVRVKKVWVLSYPLSAQWRLWSHWVDVQADLSLHWAHSHFDSFVMMRLIYISHYILSKRTVDVNGFYTEPKCKRYIIKSIFLDHLMEKQKYKRDFYITETSGKRLEQSSLIWVSWSQNSMSCFSTL